jgi:hypothetical protein
MAIPVQISCKGALNALNIRTMSCKKYGDHTGRNILKLDVGYIYNKRSIAKINGSREKNDFKISL